MTIINNLLLVRIIIFISIVFIGHDAYGKRLPFRKFYYPPEYSQYQYQDWEKIKGSLTAKILRGNDISVIIESFNKAQYLLACLAKMELEDNEKLVVRRYLFTFLQKYLDDPRFQQFLKDQDINSSRKSIDETFYYDIITMPGNILCTISALNPEEKEITEVVDFLLQMPIGKSVIEQYVISLFSDLFYFKNGHKAKKYLEEHNFAEFSKQGQNKIEGFKITLLANMTKNQKDTWRLFFQEHQKSVNRIKSDNINFNHEIFELNQTFTRVFLSQYPKPDYHLLIELSKEQNTENKFFFTLQLYQSAIYRTSDADMEYDTKKMIEDTIRQFLEENKNPDSPVNKKIYEIIALNYQFLQKSMKLRK